jgi:hypothetical protein
MLRMFFGIWVSKLHGSPWFRRDLHLKHHQLRWVWAALWSGCRSGLWADGCAVLCSAAVLCSGQTADAEERLIGLGLAPGLLRMAVTVHPIGSLLVSGASMHCPCPSPPLPPPFFPSPATFSPSMAVCCMQLLVTQSTSISLE